MEYDASSTGSETASKPPVHTFAVFVRWLHLGAIVIWIGSVFVTTATLRPALRQISSSAGALRGRIEQRVRTVGWEAVGVVVFTGLLNLIPSVADETLFETAYIRLLVAKLAGVAVLVGLQAVQTLVWVPRLQALAAGSEGAAEEATDETEARDRIERRMRRASILFLLLAAVVLFLGVELGHG